MNAMQRLERLEAIARIQERNATLDRAARKWGIDRADLEAETVEVERLIDQLGYEGAMEVLAAEAGITVEQLERELAQYEEEDAWTP